MSTKNEPLFYYNQLSCILKDLGESNIKSLDFEILISIETRFYNDELFRLFCENFSNKLLKHKRYIIDNSEEFHVNTIKFMLADSLKRHNTYYIYALEYMKVNSLSEESQIPKEKQSELKEKSYQKALEQGEEWFMNNINAINLLMPEGRKLSKKLQLNDEITVLYDGDENTPRIEFVRYNYWLNHPEYKETERALREVCDLKDSVVERSFNYEADYYMERIKNRKEDISSEEFLKRQSYKYLFDEVVSFIIKHREQNNLIEFYFGGGEPKPTLTFRGRRVKNDPVIQQYLDGSLKGADQRKYVTIKMVEE